MGAGRRMILFVTAFIVLQLLAAIDGYGSHGGGGGGGQVHDPEEQKIIDRIFRNQGKYFCARRTPMDWKTANEACKKFKMTLAMPETLADLEEIRVTCKLTKLPNVHDWWDAKYKLR